MRRAKAYATVRTLVTLVNLVLSVQVKIAKFFLFLCFQLFSRLGSNFHRKMFKFFEHLKHLRPFCWLKPTQPVVELLIIPWIFALPSREVSELVEMPKAGFELLWSIGSLSSVGMSEFWLSSLVHCHIAAQVRLPFLKITRACHVVKKVCLETRLADQLEQIDKI